MGRFSTWLAGRLDHPVIDLTNLSGVFDFRLDWTPDDEQMIARAGEGKERSADKTNGPSVFTALQEQLGLRLETRRLPVEILVIDHVEKAPTEN
jgi:uncharacterized protein (TIGR03435 family)